MSKTHKTNVSSRSIFEPNRTQVILSFPSSCSIQQLLPELVDLKKQCVKRLASSDVNTMLEGNTQTRWKIGHVCHICCFSWTSKHNKKYLRPMLPPTRWWSPSVAATRCLSFDGVSYLRIKRSLLSPFYSYSSKMDAHPCKSFSPLDFFFESSVNSAIEGLVREKLKVEGVEPTASQLQGICAYQLTTIAVIANL